MKQYATFNSFKSYKFERIIECNALKKLSLGQNKHGQNITTPVKRLRAQGVALEMNTFLHDVFFLPKLTKILHWLVRFSEESGSSSLVFVLRYLYHRPESFRLSSFTLVPSASPPLQNNNKSNSK